MQHDKTLKSITKITKYGQGEKKKRKRKKEKSAFQDCFNPFLLKL